MRTTINTTISERTRQQIDELVRRQGYSIRDIITVAVDRMHREEIEMPKFYVVHRSNWHNARWRVVAGPFAARSDAEAEPAAAGYHPHTPLGGIDTTTERHAQVVSRTWLTRHGYPATVQGDTAILEDICDARELDY